MKHSVFLVTLIIFLILLSLQVNMVLAQSAEPTLNPNPGTGNLVPLVNPLWGITIQVPSDWDLYYWLQPKGDTHSYDGGSIEFGTSHGFEGRSIADLLTELIGVLKKDMEEGETNFTIVESNPNYDVGGYKAYRLLYSEDISGYPDFETDLQKTLNVAFITGDIKNDIWYTAPDVEFDKYMPILEKIVQSAEPTLNPNPGTGNLVPLVNPLSGITIQVPSDWGALDYLMNPKGESSVEFQYNFIPYNASETNSVTERLTEAIDGIKEDSEEMGASNFTIVESNPNYNVGGYKAYRLLYSEDFSDDVQKTLHVEFINKDIVNAIVFFGAQEEFDQYLPVAEKIIQSIS